MNVYGQLSGEIFATKNLKNDSILAFPLKMTVELVNLETLTSSKITGVSSVTPVSSNYIIKMGVNHCLHLYTGASLLCQINVPELVPESKTSKSESLRINSISTPRVGASKFTPLALNQVLNPVFNT